MTLHMLDLALRSATLAMLAMLAGVLLRDARSPAGRLAAAFALGTAAHTLTLGIGASQPFALWYAPLIALSTGNAVVFWLFARALFDDGFRLRPVHAIVWSCATLFSLANCLGIARLAGAQVAILLSNGLALVFIGLAVLQAIATWSPDLVEGRRRLRLFIVSAAALYGGLNALLQISGSGSAAAEVALVANVALLTGIVAVLAFLITGVSANELFSVAPAQSGGDVSSAAQTEPADRRLVETLRRLMADERVYRQESLTIGMLAGRLGLPEYRLRRLINQQLGYRNFNAFLNDHRIAEARAALADPAQLDVPITTIALDAGFQSLGPFNRAFKTITGMTPSEYRRAKLPAM